MGKGAFLLMAAFLLCLLPRAGFAETVATIQTDSVTERDIYGGLGGGTGPIGAVTEFIAPENPAPFLALGGRHAALFTSGYVYIVEEAGNIMVCGAKSEPLSCLPCAECAAIKNKLMAMDVSKTAAVYKKLRAEYTYSAKTGAAANGYEFHKPAASGQSTPYIRAQMTAQNAAQAAERFSGKAFLFRAEAEKDYSLCPSPRYDISACLACTDCADKEALFDTKPNDATPH